MQIESRTFDPPEPTFYPVEFVISVTTAEELREFYKILNAGYWAFSADSGTKDAKVAKAAEKLLDCVAVCAHEQEVNLL